MALAETWDDTCSTIGLACRTGNLQLLQKLLQDERPVDVQDNRGWRPLHEAANGNHFLCLKELLKYEALDINWRTFEGETAVFLASSQGHETILKLLLKNKADPNIANNEGVSPLTAAVKVGSLECVQLLIKYKSNVNSQDWTGWSTLHETVKKGSLDILKCLIANGAIITIHDDYEITPIFTAAEYGELEALQYLLEKSEEENLDLINRGAVDGATPLMIASQYGFLACIEYLIEKGASVDLKTRDGVMAIHLATQFGHTRCVNKLLKHLQISHLDPIYNPKTRTVNFVSILHTAVDWERVDILKLLLSKGLKVDIESPVLIYKKDHDTLPFVLSEVFTPLSLAARSAFPNVIKILLNAGANPNISRSTSTSRAPLTSAVLSNSLTCVNLLLSHGSHVNYSSTGLLISEAALITIYNNFLPILDQFLKTGVDLNTSLAADKDSVENLVFWSVFTEGLLKHTDYTEVLTILLEYLTYSNWYRLIIKLSDFLRDKNPQLANNIWNILNSPHSLQHFSRLKVREIILNKSRKEFVQKIRQLSIPSCLCDYLLYSLEF